MAVCFVIALELPRCAPPLPFVIDTFAPPIIHSPRHLLVADWYHSFLSTGPWKILASTESPNQPP